MNRTVPRGVPLVDEIPPAPIGSRRRKKCTSTGTLGTYGPVPRGLVGVPSYKEVVEVDTEVALAEAVRDWARTRCPWEPSVVSGAVAVALDSYAGGASIAEACEEARTYVASWIDHPAHGGYRSGSNIPLAS